MEGFSSLDIGSASLLATSSTASNKCTLWQRRLRHLNKNRLSLLFQRGCLDSAINKTMISQFKNSQCDSCSLSRSHALPFPVHYSRAVASFDLIHTDVWGIAPTLSRMGFKYYVTFIDDHCRYTWIYFLRLKSEVFKTFKNFMP